MQLKRRRLSELVERTRGVGTRLVHFDLFSCYSGDTSGTTWMDDTFSGTRADRSYCSHPVISWHYVETAGQRRTGDKRQEKDKRETVFLCSNYDEQVLRRFYSYNSATALYLLIPYTAQHNELHNTLVVLVVGWGVRWLCSVLEIG